MATEIRVVDNRIFLLGLDDLYRVRMMAHERNELLRCARTVCEALEVAPQAGPVEGYYSGDGQLTEYFQRMRALQEVPESRRTRVEGSPEFKRLLDVTSSPLYGEPIFIGKLLPSGNDPLSKVLRETIPNWTIECRPEWTAHGGARRSAAGIRQGHGERRQFVAERNRQRRSVWST